LYLVLAFLQELLYDSCSSSRYHIYLHIFPPLLSSLAINSFFLLIPLFSIFFHVFLLGCYGTIVLFLLSNLLSLVHKINLSLIQVLLLLTILSSLAFLFLTFLASLLLWLPFYSSSVPFFILFFRPFSSISIYSLHLTSFCIHSGFINVLSLLLFSIPSCQSGPLLNLFTFSILFPGIYLSAKSNLDKYSIYLACLWFSFWLDIKYCRFL